MLFKAGFVVCVSLLLPLSLSVSRTWACIASHSKLHPCLQMARVCRCTLHRNFTGDPAKGGDIALLLLHRKLKVHAPVKGVKNIDECQGRTLFTLGWFTSSLVGIPPNELELVTNLTHVVSKDCKRDVRQLSEDVVCARAEGQPACKWDLGALLLCSGSHLVGLASHVADDGCGRSPYVYTYTGNLRNWIESGGIGMSIVIENPHSDCEGLADV